MNSELQSSFSISVSTKAAGCQYFIISLSLTTAMIMSESHHVDFRVYSVFPSKLYVICAQAAKR